MDTKTFVVPLDGSEFAERAIPVAAALARRIGGRVLVLTAEFGGTLQPREYLDEIVRRDLGCAIEPMFVAGKYPSSAITELLAQHDDDTLCMTTHGRGRVAWAAIGSVAEAVLRDATRPVVLVGPHCRADFFVQPGRMLIACAGEAWAGEAANDVRDWAARLDLEPRAVMVSHPLDTETTEHPEKVCDAIAGQFGVAPGGVLVVHDEYPPGGVLRSAEALGASMVVMGTHARHGLARVALGSVTIAVVRDAVCPVLAVPHAFEPQTT
jgi:nucleotide-binding universal stress UspA family protein